MANETAVVKEYMEKDSLSLEETQHLCKLVYGSEKSRNAINSMLQNMESDASFKRSANKAFKLALAYWFADRDNEAIELLGKNLKSEAAYITYLDWCLTKGLFREAFEKSEEGVKEYSSNFDILVLSARAAVMLGKNKEAESFLKKVEKTLEPLDMEKLRKSKAEPAQANKPAGDKKEEDAAREEHKDEEPRRYPRHSKVFFLKGLIEESEGRWEEAIGFYTDAIDADPENIIAYFNKAYQLDLRGMDQEALDTYEAARRLRPLRSNILFNLGVLYEDLGKHKKASQCYRTILEYNPTHFRAKLFLEDSEASRNMVYDEEEEKEQDKLLQILNTPITDFELSVRSRNCLAKMNIKTLGDLSRKTELELLSYKNFGETSLAEIKALLYSKNLALGMSTEDFFRSLDDDDEIGERGDDFEGFEHLEAVDDEPDILDTPLSEIDFSVRVAKAFEKLGLKTLGDLASSSEADFHGLRNFGETSLEELRGKLAEFGLALETE